MVSALLAAVLLVSILFRLCRDMTVCYHDNMRIPPEAYPSKVLGLGGGRGVGAVVLLLSSVGIPTFALVRCPQLQRGVRQ